MKIDYKKIAKIALILIGVFVLYRTVKYGPSKYAFLPARVKVNDIINQLPTNGSYPKRPINGITDITVHHSAGNQDRTAFDHANHHVYSNGWPGIGYHFVIDKDGTVNQTNHIDTASWHNGFNNKEAIGIVMTGNFEEYKPTEAQLKSLIKLVKMLKKRYPTIKNLAGHREVKSTSCPGKNTNLELIRRSTDLDKRS